MNTASNYADLFYHATEINTDILEKNVKDYPASSVAQFLLLYHKKRNNVPGFENSLKHIGMYLNNPFWIQYQLLQTSEINDQVVIKNNIEPALSTERELIEEIPLKSEDSNLSETSTEEKNHEINVINNYELNENKVESIPEQKNSSSEFIENPQENIESFQSSNDTKNLIVPEPEVEFERSHEDFTQEEEKNEHLQILDAETSVIHSSEPVVEPLQDNFKETEPALHLEEDSRSSETNDESIAFEPLHTVDYFASQGIKISEEVLENDQLGKQLKSFTAWLKSMKKLHPGQMPEQNEVIEKIIQSSSEASNNEANILTEAMAEVLVMQNKKEKAIEMYEKLSLINPSKSAYFAAKIESLKTT